MPRRRPGWQRLGRFPARRKRGLTMQSWKAVTVAAITALVLGSSALRSSLLSAESGRAIPPPALDQSAQQPAGLETAVLAGGCFWGVQGVFQHTEGVTSAVSGYAGGSVDTARYEMVGARQDRARRGGQDHVRPAPDQLRPLAAGILLGGARPDPAEPPGTGYRAAIPLRDLSDRRGAGAHCRSLHRAVEPHRRISVADRHQDRTRPRRFFRPRPITRTI